jgi:hypothetical protein
MYREVRGIDHLSVELSVLIRPATAPAPPVSERRDLVSAGSAAQGL